MTGLDYYLTSSSLSDESGNAVKLYGFRAVDCRKRKVVFELDDICNDSHRVEAFLALCSECHVELVHLYALIDDYFWHG